MASRKEYEMLFRLNAQLGGSYSGTFTKAQKELVATQKEIEALNKTQSDISAYQKQQGAVEATGKKLEVLQQQYDNIQREISETGTFSAALQNQLLSKQQQIDKTSASLDQQTQKLSQMGAALQGAGINTEDLTRESAKLGDQLGELKQRQEEAADKADSFGAASVQAFGAIQQAIVAAGIAKALKEIYDWYAACIAASIEYESVMAGVRRTVGGTDEVLAEISAEFKAMSLDIPITTTELGKIAETAGQLGIAQEVVTEFTEVMAMLGTATDLTAENAATMLAQFANITGLTDYERLGAAVAELGDATATTASKVVDMSQGMAAAASIAGMSETDILAISAAVGSLGIEAQAGSTAMSTLISTLYKAVETGDGLKEFAAVANMSASEFKTAWGNDAVGAMDAFIQGLNDTERNGKSAIVILDELGITNVRQTKAILGLSKAGDLLSNTIVQANRAWEENTALQAKADIMYGTTQSRLVMMQNAYNNLKVAVGDNFTPELQKLYAIGTEVLGAVTEFVQQNPALVKAVTAFVGVLGTAIVALAAYTAVMKIAKAFTAAFAATAGVALGPIIAGVAVVAALTAGIVMLAEATKKETDEAWELTAASRAQYNELQELNAQYEELVAQGKETEAEAVLLKGRINELTAEYESGKQTLAEYKAEHEALIKNYQEMAASHQEARDKLETESRSVASLISKLEELTATAKDTRDNKQAVLTVIDALNESLPELALNYDDVVSSSGDFIASLRAMAQAQADQKKLQAEGKKYLDAAGQRDALKSAKEAAEYNAQIAQEEYDLAYRAYLDAVKLSGYSYGPDVHEKAEAVRAAREQLQGYKVEIDKLTVTYEENEAALAEAEEAFRLYQQAQEEAFNNGGNISEVIRDITDQVEELAEAYAEAYDAALSSVQGQYDLWDKAEKVVATSASSINSAMESQITYWQNYNKNLSGLAERGQDIEGLGEMIASFADGSKDSVNAVAGMAKATDQELAAMVDKWKKLQKEQETVADSLAGLETDFAATMDALQSELETAIAGMNLNDEAAESGRNTIQSFINGAEDLLPAVETAYARIAKAGVNALYWRDSVGVGGYSMIDGSHAGGLDYVPFDGYIAELHKGERVLTAEEAQVITYAPRFMAYLNSINADNGAVSAESGGGSGGYMVINFSPVYNLSGVSNAAELETVLREHDENMRDYILEVVEEAGIDTARRAYR